MANLAVLACVLRAATKKMVVNFLQKKVHPGENPGYACVLEHSASQLSNVCWRSVANLPAISDTLYITLHVAS